MDEISEEKHEERRTPDVRNMFRLYEIFPNAKELLGVRYKPLADIKGTSLVCLDTNILLIPFGVAPATLETIGNVYKRLRDTDRLIIPGHVIREFVSLRSKRLNEIVQTLYNKSSQLKDQKLK